MRILLIISLAVLAACSSNKKGDEIQSSPESNSIEKLKQDGIIIKLQTETDTLKGSLKAFTEAKIGSTNILINYYSPATRGRMIWGGLVAYDNVWVTGAHKATNIEFDRDIIFGETLVPAGKYAFFTVPSMDHWKVILNKNWNQHLTDDYSETEDVMRLTVNPNKGEAHQERLRYAIENVGNSGGAITIHWDKLKLTLPFSVAK